MSRQEELLRGLDASQVAVVTSDARLLAVVAAAGSGKTAVLTRRIAARVERGDAIARHVLALTFTRQAAAELRGRLRGLGIDEPIEAGTFHAIAYRSLRERARDRGQREPVIATDRMRLLREAAGGRRSQAELTALAGEIDWARARAIPADEYPGAARTARRRAGVSPPTVMEAMAAYETVKHRRGVVDMDDLLDHLLAAMRSDPAWADAQRWRYRHLLVDEAQDMNPLQHAVLEAWRDGRDDLMLVGDPRQAIYGWNGSDPDLLAHVERHYMGITVMRLSTNRRSTEAIVRAGAAVLAAAGLDDDSVAARPDGAPVEVRSAADEHAEAALIANLVITSHGHPASWASIAVLVRTNAQLPLITDALQRAGVPTTALGDAARSPLQIAVAETLACRSREQLAGWADRTLADSEAHPDRRRVAEALDLYLARSLERGAERAAVTWRSWIELNNPFELLVDEARDRVTLSTFHAAKGREWSTVVLAGIEDGLVPHSSAVRPEQRAEEARLLYVALTRAADRAVITTARSRAGRPATASPFLQGVDLVDGHLATAVVPPPPLLTGARVATRVDPLLAELRAWRATAARAAGMDEQGVLSDRAVKAIVELRPDSPESLAQAAGLGPITAQRLWPRLAHLLLGPAPGADQSAMSSTTGA